MPRADVGGGTRGGLRDVFVDVERHMTKQFRRAHTLGVSGESLAKMFVGDAVLVEPNGEVVHVFGDANRLLATPQGPMSTSITALCEGPLGLLVGALLTQVLFTGERIESGAIEACGERITVIVDPVLDPHEETSNLLVRFITSEHDPSADDTLPEDTTDARILKLEQELLATRVSLRAELERSWAVNAELERANDELERANAMYRRDIQHLYASQVDHTDLLDAADVSVVVLSSSREVRFFSQMATRAFHLLPVDIGRDLADIRPRFDGVDLFAAIDAVLDGADETRHIVSLPDNRFMRIDVKPHVVGHDVSGALLSFTDVTEAEYLRRTANQARALIEQVMDDVPVGIWQSNAAGDNSLANAHLTAWAGRSSEEFRARGWEGLIHPDDIVHSYPAWIRANQENHDTYLFRLRMLHHSGSYRWVEFRGISRKDASGTNISWNGAMVDVHEEHIAKLELERFNQDLEELVAQRSSEIEAAQRLLREVGSIGSDGYVDYAFGTGECFVSPGFIGALGFDPDEVVDAKALLRAQLFADDAVKGDAAILHHVDDASVDNVVRFVHADGSIRHMLRRAVIERDESGEPVRMVGTFADITALKRAEAELVTQRSLEHSRILVQRVAEFAPIMLWLANQSGAREYFNSTWLNLTGRTHDDALGQGWLEGVHPDDRARVVASIEGAVANYGASYTVEYRLRSHDGTYLPVSEHAAPYFDDEGAFAGYIGTVLDLTEQHRLAEEHRAQLEHIKSHAHLESLGVLAGGIAHDFNNILTAIIGPASIAKEEVDRDSEVYFMLTEVERAAQRAADLCRMLMDASGGVVMAPEVVRLNALITDSVSLLPAARRKSANLVWGLSSTDVFVEADPTQLRRMIMNVVLNACDALGGEPGDVCVSTRVVDASASPPSHLAPSFEPVREGQFVVFEVGDTGRGISREDMRRIFEPFFSTKTKGRGLGLSATLGALRAAGGFLEVESILGEGTSMRLWFPYIMSRRARIAEAPSLPLVDAHFGDATVLVVDDDPSVATTIARALGRGGLDVHTAHSATDALTMCDALETTPRLAFVGYTMPGMFGDALAARLRERYPDIGIILLSGYSVEHSDAALDDGTFDAFISKPFTLQHIIDVTCAHLDG